MRNKVSPEFIKQFRAQHKLDPASYVKPTVQSERLFTVGYAIKPFRICANEWRTHGGCICFS
ncbi:MAG: hypothetical protein WAP20_09650 [Limnochordia bacterium]|nr:hypothetical protein [Bacillota bacterium]HOB08172.1 hypothetical protein [Limnochordia bacterium]NLH31089.1 hypothetical protein [Bacillota bacterium]HPT92323.1 hypothetical protein [Limnochordia bacterium]HPZ30299.1 hypothetical protein [Limnochordia bacterium]